MSRSAKSSPPFRFSNQNYTCIYHLPQCHFNQLFPLGMAVLCICRHMPVVLTLIKWTLKISLLHGNSSWSIKILAGTQSKSGHRVTLVLGIAPPAPEVHPCWKHFMGWAAVLGVMDHLNTFPSWPRHTITCVIMESRHLDILVSACKQTTILHSSCVHPSISEPT